MGEGIRRRPPLPRSRLSKDWFQELPVWLPAGRLGAFAVALDETSHLSSEGGGLLAEERCHRADGLLSRCQRFLSAADLAEPDAQLDKAASEIGQVSLG